MLAVEQRDKVLLLTLNRPDKRNALHPELIAALLESLYEASDDPAINIIVITGAGPSFCAGLDLDFLLSQDDEGKIEYLEIVFALFQQIYTQPQPVIAAINGPAMAGGFDLAAMCDFRLCAPSATFAQTEILLGLTQIMYPLYKVIGLSRAKELAMTGETINADEAYRIGLVNHVFPAEGLMAEAMKLAEKLASRPRLALFETKRLSRELIDLDTQSAFRRMGKAIRERIRSDEHKQMLNAFTNRMKQRD